MSDPFAAGYRNTLEAAQRNAVTGPEDLPTPFDENVAASYRLFRSEDQSVSQERHYRPDLDAKLDAIEKLDGDIGAAVGSGRSMMERGWRERYRWLFRDDEKRSKFEGLAKKPDEALTAAERAYLRRHEQDFALWGRVRALEAMHPDAIPTDAAIMEKAKDRAAKIRQASESVMRRATPGGKAGQFFGMIGGAMTDPVNLLTLPFGATTKQGATLASNMGRLAAGGAVVEGITETAIQPNVYEWKQALGVDYTVRDAAVNVLAAMTGGAILEPAGHATAKGLAGGYGKLRDAYRATGREPADAAEKAAAQVLEETAEAEAMAPPGVDSRTHLEALDKARLDVSEGRIADTSEIVPPPAEDSFGFPAPARALPDEDPLLRETIELADNPDRIAEVHDPVVQKFTADAPTVTGRAPVVYVFGGGGASGKGTLKQRLARSGRLPESTSVKIDPDDIKDEIPEYRAILSRGDGRAAAVVHEESSLLAKRLQREAIEGRKDVILDVTLGNPEKGIAKLQQFKDAGYKVELFGVTVDPALALQRAVDRARSSKREVPPRDLLAAHRGFSQGWERYAALADRAILFDTNLQNLRVAASKSEGGKLEINDERLYNEFARKGEINVEAQTLQEIYPQQPEPATARPPGHAVRQSGRSAPADNPRGMAADHRREGSRGAGASGKTAQGLSVDQDALGRIQNTTDTPDLQEVTNLQADDFARLVNDNPDMEIPVDVRVDAEGEIEVIRRPLREVFDELDRDERAVQSIISCMQGAA